MSKNALTTKDDIKNYFDNKCGEAHYNCYLKFKGNDFLSDVLFHTYKIDAQTDDNYVHIVALPGLTIDDIIIRYIGNYSEGHVVYKVKLS